MTHVEWKPYPKEKPKNEEFYLVTFIANGLRYVIEDFYAFDCWHHAFGKVIAWAEKPEPYREDKK